MELFSLLSANLLVAARPGSWDAAFNVLWQRHCHRTDRAPIARELLFVGSVKWLENSPFDRHDLVALHRHCAALTPDPVPVLAVSRSGADCAGLDAVYGPAELLEAWSR
ncbi:hypothetical protein ACL02S_08635 [Nocardia sp. 004]|uniref:hypothetical protein n=1 Tax=Nocardia sp. 004 TaxID=3385978 RepID=UPI0039A26F85